MSAARKNSAACAAVQGGLALLFVTAGTALAALLHSVVWSALPAILGLIGYVVFAGRAMRVWQGPGIPCLHFPPCWPGTRAEDHRRVIG
jgi:hypothetical protein